jgi:murein DD-endopeptidase MepM/ murein hydrolase activator NlpD
VRALLAALLAALCAGDALRAASPVTSVTVPPGGVARWPAPFGAAVVSCSRDGQPVAPIGGACYFPVDLDASGRLSIARTLATGVSEARTLVVGHYPWPTERLTVEEKYVSPPANELERIARDQRRAGEAFARRTERRFTLPLGAPLAVLPEAGRFGARRVFNGQSKSPHSGADFRAAAGVAVFAPADGTVVVAESQYFPGNAVFVDHGDGLVSMAFHLSAIGVEEGQAVRRGDKLGEVGATGRVTGPHLHFALRWRGAKIDPEALLDPQGHTVEVR